MCDPITVNPVVGPHPAAHPNLLLGSTPPPLPLGLKTVTQQM